SLPSPAPSPSESYALSLHDALPIWIARAHILLEVPPEMHLSLPQTGAALLLLWAPPRLCASHLIPTRKTPPAPHPDSSNPPRPSDRKSTRLNSSHLGISYAVFCLKK